VISRVGPSWRDTFVLLYCSGGGEAWSLPRLHVPIPMPGVYSNEFYQSHLCRSFAIPSAWLDEAGAREGSAAAWQVPRVNADELSAEVFLEKYEGRNQPVVVTGGARVRALEKWIDDDYLLRHNAPSKSFRTTSGAAPLPVNFSLEAYQAYGRFDYLEESPMYLFDRTAFAANQRWSDDFFPEFYRRCPQWDPSGRYGHDLLQHLGPEGRPDHTWMIIGPKRSGSVFHIDPNATHAWNACIRGRKRWIFYPPGEPPPGVFPSEDGDEVALPLSIGEWIIQFWTEHLERYRTRPPEHRPMECTVYPGDVIFVPHGWWHCVVNLDDCNIAITHNYVSPSNLGNALKFFAEKEDQISGCRDREESIKPEFLRDEFVKAMRIKEPRHLERALRQTGWTCRAWRATGMGDGATDTGETAAGEVRKGYVQQRAARDCQKRRRLNYFDGNHQYAGNFSPRSCVTNAGREEGTSVMAKTEKIQAFSFSFL
jgi:Cupin-like domain